MAKFHWIVEFLETRSVCFRPKADILMKSKKRAYWEVVTLASPTNTSLTHLPFWSRLLDLDREKVLGCGGLGCFSDSTLGGRCGISGICYFKT